MSFDPKNVTFIPCDPFESVVYDIMQDAYVKARIIGYRVAIRAIKNPPDAMFMPIDAGQVEPRHASIIGLAWESLEPDALTQVSASPNQG